MRSLDSVFPKLAASPFRSRFRLGPKERAYLDERSIAVILEHAADFIAKRLAPAQPANDGKQTPMRGGHVNGKKWDFPAVQKRWAVRQLLP